jgi:L-fuconolactonase
VIIDAHQHLWQIGKNGHEWPTPDLEAIHRDFGVDDLTAVTAACGVTGTVLVQSQPNDADTDWMLGVAAATPLIKGVVGWADLAAADAPDRIAHLARQPKLKGLRPMLQGMADDEWILRPEVQPALDAMTRLGLTFDALIFPRHLTVIGRLALARPSLRLVIDHGAKPPIARNDTTATQAWRDGISAVARRPNVMCKLSGLITEAAAQHAPDVMQPYADHLLQAFGPERLMWGSDWPVLALRLSYRQWFDWTRSWLDRQGLDHQGIPAHSGTNAIMGGTAAAFYSLT